MQRRYLSSEYGLRRNKQEDTTQQILYDRNIGSLIKCEQREQVKEREATEKASLAAGLRVLYPSVWLLTLANNNLVLDKVEIGGRPVRADNIHARLVELLIDVNGKLFNTLRTHEIT